MKPKLSLMILVVVCGGCELAGPLLIGEATSGDDEVGSEAAALSVEVESASGIVAGRSLAPEMLTATGDRFGSQLSFQLMAAGEEGIEVFVSSNAESSSMNPYTGEGGGGFGEPGFGEGPRGDGSGSGPGFISEPFADVTICQLGECRSATDFGVELVETADGRSATIDGVWGPDESLEVTLHYTEIR